MTTLNDLIRLNPEAPALDPLIVDCIGKDESGVFLVVRDGLAHLSYRLKQAGFYSFKMLLVGNPGLPINIQVFRKYSWLTLIYDEYVPKGTVYLLTVEAGGRKVIHLPYDMTWEQYLIKVMRGEFVHLFIDMPWAQAKFINVLLPKPEEQE